MMNKAQSGDGREEILQRLRQKARSASLPQPWRSRRRFEDLADRFEEALTAVHGEVQRAPDLEAALDQLASFLETVGAHRIVATNQPPLTDINLRARFPAFSWYVPGSDDQENLREFAATADVGLSGAETALAETGTIVLHSGSGRSRLATLLPPIHAVLLPETRLTVDIFTWAADRPAVQPSNITFISGPSKTADIEQTLSVGVHGPKRLVVFLYGG